MQRIVDATPKQPETANPKQFSRYALGDVYARDGQWMAAERELEKAWKAGRDPKVGAFLVTAYLENDRPRMARHVLGELESTIKPYDKRGQQILKSLRSGLAQQEVSSVK